MKRQTCNDRVDALIKQRHCRRAAHSNNYTNCRSKS